MKTSYWTPALTPSNPFVQALSYARERRSGLTVFLTGRADRYQPWLFCGTELGAKCVGIIQSLIVACRLHEIDPYTYLVDVLQRLADLTPRLWKQHFAANRLRSDIHEFPR